MATTSNAAMRKKTPFHVAVFRKRTTSMAFHWPVRVYWEDTNDGGVVYYAN